IDAKVARFMRRWGHPLERELIGLLFIWLGALKMLGYKSATSIIAETIYAGAPEIMVPLLGVWEVVIGACLLYRPLLRLAVLLIVVRLPGTLLALALKPEVCWTDTWMVPTIQGQYLIKDCILFAAAMVIGGAVRKDR